MSESPSFTIETPAVLVHGEFADSPSWDLIINWLLSGELSLPDLADPTFVCESDSVESQFTYEMGEPGRQRWPQFSVPPRRLI